MERIYTHPVLGPRRIGANIKFTFDGRELEGFEDEPVAAALLANGIRVLRRHEESGTPRGFYCAIGHCMECRVEVDGRGPFRACITPLKTGMRIQSGRQLSNEITGRYVEHGGE